MLKSDVYLTFPAHERLGREKLFIMHHLSPLHKAPVLMLYSGALSVTPHNCVHASATNCAPQQKQKNQSEFFGGDRMHPMFSLRSVAHDGERSSIIARLARDFAPLVRALATQ